MADLKTKFKIDIVGLTGKTPDLILGIIPENFVLRSTTIQFFLDEVFISQFILQEDYDVFMEARPTPVVGASKISTEDTVKDLNKWIEFINKFVNLPLFPQSKFIEEIEKDVIPDEIKYKFTLGSDLLLDAAWHKDTDLLDFGSRVEAIVSLGDFVNYVDALNKLMFVEIPNALKK